MLNVNCKLSHKNRGCQELRLIKSPSQGYQHCAVIHQPPGLGRPASQVTTTKQTNTLQCKRQAPKACWLIILFADDVDPHVEPAGLLAENLSSLDSYQEILLFWNPSPGCEWSLTEVIPDQQNPRFTEGHREKRHQRIRQSMSIFQTVPPPDYSRIATAWMDEWMASGSGWRTRFCCRRWWSNIHSLMNLWWARDV